MKIFTTVLAILMIAFACGCGSDSHTLAAPTGLLATASTGQVAVTWGAVSGATNYDVFWGTSSGVTPATGSRVMVSSTSFTHTTTVPGEKYYYTVRAAKGSNVSALSSEVDATLPLLPPATLALTSAASQNVLTWAEVAGANSYNIYWANAPGVTPATGTKIGGLTATTYTHSGLTPGASYYYVVTAVSEHTESALSGEQYGKAMDSGGKTISVSKDTGGKVTLQLDANTILDFTIAPGTVDQATDLLFEPMTEAQLPVAMKARRYAKATVKKAATANGTYIGAFQISATPTLEGFNLPIVMGGTIPTTFTKGTTINLATFKNNEWEDVITAVVGDGGVFVSNLPSASLMGILHSGKYLLYRPEIGGNTSVSNLGIALIADDGDGRGESADAVQVIHLYDANGAPLAVPTITYLKFSGAGDLDGQALTPDGSQGILVDGGNTVRFFSGVQTGTPVASTTVLDVSAWGYDGDSIAILPNGDEAIVSVDSSSKLLVVSGIVSGNPVVADTIPIISSRDGLVSSNDGKTLLARARAQLTVFAIDAITPKAGSIGGTIAHSFTKTAELTLPGYSSLYDGREGMAMSPADSTRAVVLTSTSIIPLSGLPANPVLGTELKLGDVTPYAVSISPDGKLAVVGTSNGLLLFSGVDTGTLVQVTATPFTPNYTGSVGSTTLRYVATLGITLDGKYVVACDQYSESLLTIPFTAAGFSAPVGVLTGVAVPSNDQLLIH